MPAIDVDELLRNTGAIMEGHFKLASGRHSGTYIEKFRIIGEEADQPYRVGRIETIVEPTAAADRDALRHQRRLAAAADR